jgi:pimeloyl-ACP methyl ester carboxylesterase
MFSKTHRFSQFVKLAVCVAVTLSLHSQRAIAQTTAAKPQPTKKSGPTIPAPEVLQLTTKDGVQLKCTYFGPASPEGAEADGTKVIPYLVLHDWGSSSEDTKLFGKFLQMQGNAALVPDLRGHGESTVMSGIETQAKPLDYDKFRPADIATVLLDIESCKKQLVKLNNEGKLNIDMLTVVAIGDTAPIATQWVIQDWYQYPAFNMDGIKQAQDVKLLALISPGKKNGPFSMAKLAKNRLFNGERALPTVVMWGTSSDEAKEAESLFKRLEKNRPDVDKISKDQQSLFAAKIPTSTTGRKMMADSRFAQTWLGIHRIARTKIGQIADELPWKNRAGKKKK